MAFIYVVVRIRLCSLKVILGPVFGTVVFGSTSRYMGTPF